MTDDLDMARVRAATCEWVVHAERVLIALGWQDDPGARHVAEACARPVVLAPRYPSRILPRCVPFAGAVDAGPVPPGRTLRELVVILTVQAVAGS